MRSMSFDYPLQRVPSCVWVKGFELGLVSHSLLKSRRVDDTNDSMLLDFLG